MAHDAFASSGNCLNGVSLSEPCDLCLKVSDVNGGGAVHVPLVFDLVYDVVFDFASMRKPPPNLGFPSDPDATVLVDCMHCSAMIEVRTGCRGIDDALSQGWEIDGAGDLICPACSEARAEIIGEEG